ncbi:hypothetical protein [Nonomuraea dietziae]|uniref:hypothetical protein n=1 Tax=Nonomuraea dietziae TaxID=65515 RepID=UPI003416F863
MFLIAANVAAWLRGRLATDLASARQLADELAAIAGPIDGDGDQVDVEPSTGWENELGELAHRLALLANTIKASVPITRPPPPTDATPRLQDVDRPSPGKRRRRMPSSA